jgi:hypothetical protein
VSLTYVKYPTIDRPKRAVTDKGARKLRARGAQSKDAPPEGGEVRGDPAENEHTDTALRVIAEERYDDADLRQ